MALGTEYLQEIAELQLMKLQNYVHTHQVYFNKLKDEKLIYGNDIVINDDEKPMVMRITLRISYEEFPK